MDRRRQNRTVRRNLNSGRGSLDYSQPIIAYASGIPDSALWKPFGDEVDAADDKIGYIIEDDYLSREYRQAGFDKCEVRIERSSANVLTFQATFRNAYGNAIIVELPLSRVPALKTYWAEDDSFIELDVELIAKKLFAKFREQFDKYIANEEILKFVYNKIDVFLSRAGLELYSPYKGGDNTIAFDGPRSIYIRFGALEVIETGDVFVYEDSVASFNDADLIRYAQRCADTILEGIEDGTLFFDEDF